MENFLLLGFGKLGPFLMGVLVEKELLKKTKIKKYNIIKGTLADMEPITTWKKRMF